MKALVLESLGPVELSGSPLRLTELPSPHPGPDDLLVEVNVCGVCHTELDEIEGRTPPASLPMILGHQVVGTVVATGIHVNADRLGERVGVAWINSSCGNCRYCSTGLENLCPDFRATGRDRAGGYAEYLCIHQDFAFPLPASLRDEHAAPLLCAGAIGYRSLSLASLGKGDVLGLTGFGASGHLVMKLIRYLHPETTVLVFARSDMERKFALTLGADWAGDIHDTPPVLADAIIDTTPAWAPALVSLRNLSPNGRLIVNAIRKEEADKSAWMHLDYALDLWMEKEIKTVANVTRTDVIEFLALAAKLDIKPKVELFPLEEANQVLKDLKFGHIEGAKVLRVRSAQPT